MKIVVTGHTSGLGKSLYQSFSKNHHVIGLSRSNGYNLESDIEPFVAHNFDVYINNAYYKYSQVDILYELFNRNKYKCCTIINIGSVSADGNRDTVNEYAVHKSSLEKACTQLQLIDSECKVVHLKLGRMNTPMTDHRKEYPRMDTDYIADTMDWIIKQPQNILVKNLTLDIMHSRRKVIL